jgi:hypothetical protein
MKKAQTQAMQVQEQTNPVGATRARREKNATRGATRVHSKRSAVRPAVTADIAALMAAMQRMCATRQRHKYGSDADTTVGPVHRSAIRDTQAWWRSTAAVEAAAQAQVHEQSYSKNELIGAHQRAVAP